MADILHNKLNLRILSEICAGNGVSVNYSYLAGKLKQHRLTIRKRVNHLFEHEIINKPIFPFFGQFKEHAVLIMSKVDMPLNQSTEKWIAEDPHIFSAYKLQGGVYNMLLLLFHRTLYRYQLWRLALTKDAKIPPRHLRFPSSASFFSTQMIIKYNPAANIELMQDELTTQGSVKVDHHLLKKDDFEILKLLVYGKGIRINESFLSVKLKINKKTLRNRIDKLLKSKMILEPVCRFNAFFCPPGFLLVISLLEIQKMEKKIVSDFKKDSHISLAFRVCTERYNYLLFKAFRNMDAHIQWEQALHEKYPYCFGMGDSIYVTPSMTINMDQQKVSLALIRKKLEILEKGKKEEKWDPLLKEVWQ